jgi:hypothetical protein
MGLDVITQYVPGHNILEIRAFVRDAEGSYIIDRYMKKKKLLKGTVAEPTWTLSFRDGHALSEEEIEDLIKFENSARKL